MTKDLSQEDYHVLTLEVVKQTPCSESQLNATKNLIVGNLANLRKNRGKVEEKDRPASRQPHQVDLGAGHSSSSKLNVPSFPTVIYIMHELYKYNNLKKCMLKDHVFNFRFLLSIVVI